MACTKWKNLKYIFSKSYNFYLYNKRGEVSAPIEYCPFCGSELDEDGCTQGRLTIQVFGTMKERFDKLEVKKPTVMYRNKEELRKFKELMGDNVNYKKTRKNLESG